MSVQKQRFHLSGVSIAVLTALSFNAFGQENTSSTNGENTSEDVVEVIEVKGLKGSLKNLSTISDLLPGSAILLMPRTSAKPRIKILLMH